MKETYLTRDGVAELKAKLQELKTVRRREIAEAIHAAKEHGDLSENAEYVDAKEEQRRIEQQIAEIEVVLKSAQIVTKAGTHQVGVGNTVTLMCAGIKKEFTIVGSNEADPLGGKISNESPVGQALLGRKRGDSVVIPTPTGDKDCEIVKIT